MTHPETNSSENKSFERAYGSLVADLVVQSRVHCHDQNWVAMAAGQLTDVVTSDSGLERDEVRMQLNSIWPKVLEVGPTTYIQRLSELSLE